MAPNTQTDTRLQQTMRLIADHPSVATQEFLDRFHRAMDDLINGRSEQVCLNRQNDRGEIRVEWTPITEGERERWSR